MLDFALTLRLTRTTAAPAAAWFIAGADTAEWLAELSRWGVPLGGVRLYPVPESARTRRPCGVLAITAGKPAVVRALPYATLGGRLFHPADAVVDPPVSAAELATAVRHDVLVLHPAAGPVGFASDDAVHVHDLLAPPPRRAADWSHADAGPPPLPRLVSVEADPVPKSLDQLLAGGRDDIGSATGGAMPRVAGESPARDAAAGVARPLLRFVSSLPLGPLRLWANSALARVGSSLQARRDRELDRLLELLTSDPDAGLQHALPVRDMATRGVAPPSDRLGRTDVDFDLGDLSGGNRRRDGWAIAEAKRQQLIARYRAAANRELNLGRYRRAAYIFAHLLGDFAAAADALKRGRDYREAAALYRDQLKNLRAAADCLAAGGLLAEAILLYRELGQFETAGDLHARLGEPAAAAARYREAVDQNLHHKHLLAATRLLETKLAAADEALALLEAAWPESESAGSCLAEWFAMAGRLGRHDRVAGRVRQVRDGPVPTHLGVTLVRQLAAVAVSSPDATVRHRAADAARVVAGRRLPTADATDRHGIVRALVSLAPGDRLLNRDGTQFLEPQARPKLIPLRPTSPVVRSFRLPGGDPVRTVVPLPGGFLALTVGTSRITLVRGRWDGRQQSVWADRKHADRWGYALLPPGPAGRTIVLAPLGISEPFEPVGPLTLPRTDVFDEEVTTATPPFVGPGTYGLCMADNGTLWTWTFRLLEGALLSAHANDGAIQSTHSLDDHGVGSAPVPMAVRRGEVFAARFYQLLRWSPGQGERPAAFAVQLPAHVRSMAASPPQTAVRMLVTFDEGAALVRDGDVYPFAGQLVRPAVTFTPDGAVVAVGPGVAHVYRRSAAAEVSLVSRFDVPAKAAVAVLPAGAGRVAVFDADGGVWVCRYAAT